MSRGVVVRLLVDHGRRIRLGGESKQIFVRRGCWCVVAWSRVVVEVVVGVSVVVVECWAVCRSCFDLTLPPVLVVDQGWRSNLARHARYDRIAAKRRRT